MVARVPLLVVLFHVRSGPALRSGPQLPLAGPAFHLAASSLVLAMVGPHAHRQSSLLSESPAFVLPLPRGIVQWPSLLARELCIRGDT